MKIIDDIGDPVITNAARRWLRDPRGQHFSVTELVSPTWLAALRRKHWDGLEQPVSQMMWALMGSALHEVLHKGAEGTPGLSEHRMTENIGDSAITGALDYYSLDEDGTLVDYKSTSVFAVIEGHKLEWEQQLNGYAMLLRTQGHSPKRLQIKAMLRDWYRSKASRDPEYPQTNVVTLDIPMWPDEQAQAFFKERAALLTEALKVRGEPDLTKACSAEERWAKPDTWAVVKAGNQRASRVLASEVEAFAWLAEQKNPGAYLVEHRPGENTRCQFHCPVSRVCGWWARNAT